MALFRLIRSGYTRIAINFHWNLRRMSKEFSGAPQFVKYFGPVLEALKQLGGSGRPDEVRSVIAQRPKSLRRGTVGAASE